VVAKYKGNGNDEPFDPEVRVCGRNKGGVDIILLQEYLTPRVTYADVPDVRPVTLLSHSVKGTWHVNWIVFVHRFIEGPRS